MYGCGRINQCGYERPCCRNKSDNKPQDLAREEVKLIFETSIVNSDNFLLPNSSVCSIERRTCEHELLTDTPVYTDPQRIFFTSQSSMSSCSWPSIHKLWPSDCRASFTLNPVRSIESKTLSFPIQNTASLMAASA